jgi:1,4-dihydroxy-2-naphthoate polyprenyltransferase
VTGVARAPGLPPGPLRRWVLGARPRTLVAAAVPVLVGTAVGVSVASRHLVWWRALCALVVALGVQVGTNYVNDYADGVRGTDAPAQRVGPVRLVAWGLASPAQVRWAALAAFGVAGVAGLALAAATSWWVLLVGAACMAAGWAYTAGPAPYGYLGLGEAFVFVFFGVVATVGSAYVQHAQLSWLALAASLPVGLLATALLEANNLRDIDGDRVSGKRTLAVRLGRGRAGALYVALVAAAGCAMGVVAIWRPWALLALAAAPLAVAPIRVVLGPARGRELLVVLGATARVQLVAGVLLTAGILL